MPAYLLTWNPLSWEWPREDLEATVADVMASERPVGDWSSGRCKRIQPGDRIFFLKQGVEPRGIIGTGYATSSPAEGPHWSGGPGYTLYVEFYFDDLVDGYKQVLVPRDVLISDPRFSAVHWNTQSSGISVPDDVANELLNYIAERKGRDVFGPRSLPEVGAPRKRRRKTKPASSREKRKDTQHKPEDPLPQSFVNERQLQEFIYHNWSQLPFTRDWRPYGKPGDLRPGFEYRISNRWRIDLLGKHRRGKRWLVIELKLGKTNDQVIGQVLRYMAWVTNNLAAPGEEVRGLIVTGRKDPGLQSLVDMLPLVDLITYDVKLSTRTYPEQVR